MGFSIFRVAGEDRKETSLQLYKTFKDYFRDDFAVVVVDMHRASISRGKRLAIRNSVPLFFCDVSELEDMLKEISELGIEEVKIITGNRQDDLRTTCEKRLKEAQNRLEDIEVTELNEEVVQECVTLLEQVIEAFEDGNYLLCLEYLADLEKLLNELEE
jgi:putative cell wall-binding protein